MIAFLEGPDLIIVLVIVVLLFGGAKLPKLARSLGEAKRELDKGMAGDPAAPPVVNSTSTPPPVPPTPPTNTPSDPNQS